MQYLTIGQTAQRSGISVSALRFYEERGLISSIRTQGNQRLYHRATLRRVSIIRVAQTLGFTLREIGGALTNLPDKKTPTKRDWERLSTKWGRQLDERIVQMQRMRERLTRCIGCGCLSLKTCSLYNPDDRIASMGAGPRFLLDAPSGTE